MVAILGLGLMAGLLGWGVPVHGQKMKRPPFVVQPGDFLPMGAQPDGSTTPGTTAAQFSAIKLEDKSEYRVKINAARDCISDKDWPATATVLQGILDTPENFYVQIREKDSHNKETLRWTSIKFEANNLLGTLPDEALDIYELHSGAKAKDRLDEAKRTGDRSILKEVALTYMFTKAGIEANDLLATYFLDRGDFFMAALRLEKLLAMNPERAKLSDLTLFKAVLAYNRAGDKKNSDKAWARLEPRLREQGGLKINGDVVTIARLNEFLGEKTSSLFIGANDWPMIHGNLTNSAQATGSQPLLDAADIIVTRPTVLDKEEGGGPAGQFAADRLREAINHQRSLPNAAVMSGTFPIAANKLAIYRTYRDLRAVYLYNGKDPLGQDAAVGKIFWQTRDFDGALTPVMENSRYRSVLDGWIQQFASVPGFRSLLYENSLLGTISTDHRLVYAVDDLAVPAPGNLLQFIWNQPNMTPELRTLLMQNSLYAVNINTGKYEWRLGVGKADEMFADSHFLGAPISVGGNLWVLNEKNSGFNGDAELRLVCIDPYKQSSPGRPTIVGKLEKLGLVQQQHRFTHDISRRTNAVHLAYADGVLVCPTNAGEVLGVDLLSRSLAWSYPYREQATNVHVGVNPFQPPFRPFPQPNMPMSASPANWKSAPPVIQDGKVVFTAPDANSVHCISLRDGRPVWKKKQMDGDLFLAGVFQGKVLIAGRNSLRALSLNDGSQLWSVSTGNLPSGQGVASKNVYYLPLQKGEIIAVDIERGIVKAHNRAKGANNPDQDPGNLLYYEGTVLSQTPTQLVIYPQLTAKLEMVTKQLEADPTSLEKLVTRGELLFADGQVQPAVDSLQLALKKDLTPELRTRARNKLYEALTDLLQTDFKTAGAKYMDEYREFCNVPGNEDEQQQRLAKFYRIVGQGYEETGNLVNAFHMYRKFGELPINSKEVVASIDDPMHKVPTSVWLRGRVAGMMARAPEAQKLPLENKIAEEWKQVKAKKDINAIRTFVDMFDVPFAVGRESRLHLAQTIIELNDRPSFLEAELNLQQLRGSDYFSDVNLSARALATLAKLEEKKGSADAMKLAAAYYRELRRDYPQAILDDKKTTAADLVDELTTNPLFLPYLEEPGPLWNKEKIAARELKDFAGGLQGFVFQPEGDLNQLMKQHRLVLDLTTAPNPQLRLYNFGTGAVRWTQNLGAGPGQNNFQYFQYLYQQGQNNGKYFPNARFRFYQVRGNLAVFQVGAVAYCLDMDSSRILWQQNLVENLPTQQPGMIIQQVQPDADGNLEIMVWNQMNGQRSRIAIGHVGAVQASYVALVTQKGLTVVDPLRGTVLWRKLDVPVRTRVFGDDQYLFLVDEADGGAVGAGRAMRAIDGATVAAADFSGIYQNKVRIMGRKILAAVPGPNKLTMKLYDILSGKDLWSKDFHAKAVVLSTEDANLTGVIEPNGQVTALDVDSGKVVLSTQAIVGRVTAEDIANLSEPLLLQDRDRFYLAVNQPLDGAKVSGNMIFNNFGNGLRCRIVNGWLMSFFRDDGRHMENGLAVEHKRGDFHWHSSRKLDNQLIVLEQFEQLPVILLSARHNEPINGGGGGSRWLSTTTCLLRSNGKAVYDPGPRATAGVGSSFSTFSVDPKERTINLISAGQGNPTVQLYVDDDRKPVQGDGVAPAPGVGGNGGVTPPKLVEVPGPLPRFVNPALREVIAPPAPPGEPIAPPMKK